MTDLNFDISKDPAKWQEFDRRHIWHPYTSMRDPLPAYTVTGARGVALTLADGRELIDGMASWWTAIHGYNHPRLNTAVAQQLASMAHVMFGGITHGPAVALAERLIKLTAPSLDHVFFCDSGSVSVEVAIKMAIQYWFAQGCQTKQRLLTVRGGYHGDTFGAMSVCDPVNGMHQMFTRALPGHLFAPKPRPDDGTWEDDWISEFKTLLETHHEEIAAVIVEPIVQGAGGMNIYHPQYLRWFRRLCDDHDVLLIFDEIATGFGRTGKLFAYEHAGVVPDIICLGKAMTGGYMTLAATLASEKVAKGISADGSGVLMHGPTFMGNPLACQVAVESIELLLDSPWEDRVGKIEQQIARELAPCRDLPNVKDVRHIGAIGVVETREPVPMPAIQEMFVDRGVWIRPFGRLVYIMPPYIIKPEELSRLTGAMYQVLAESSEMQNSGNA